MLRLNHLACNRASNRKQNKTKIKRTLNSVPVVEDGAK